MTSTFSFLQPGLKWFEASGWPKLQQIVLVCITCLAILWAVKLLTKGIRRAVDDGNDGVTTESERRAETLASVLMNTAKVAVLVFLALAVLQTFGVNIGPLLAGASIAGVALGFGAQALVKDVISGFFLLLENQFGVGDIINVDDQNTGTVERMTLRVTMLRDAEGRAHYLPNGTISKVIVLSKDFARALVDVPVGSGEDIDRVIGLLKQIGAEMQREMPGLVTEVTEVKGIESINAEGCIIRTLTKTAPGQQWDVAREFRRRVLLAFRREGINMPMTQRIIWNRKSVGAE